MKPEIHPKYYKTKAICACGAAYDIGSTKEKIHVDICSNCHPLFTGKQKLLDIEGRVQKFKKKYAGVTPKAKKPVKKSAKGGSASGGKKLPAKKAPK